jgi:hypothetical protein
MSYILLLPSIGAHEVIVHLLGNVASIYTLDDSIDRDHVFLNSL